jgi:hypothetical protein
METVRYAARVKVSALHVIAACALAAGAMVIPAAVQARTTANPAITVKFSLTGTITVSGPDGNPLGVTSGTPPVIPAGYYTVNLVGPGGCANIPYFELHGPGENIANNLTEGELDNDVVNAFLQPNSTYTWRNRDVPGNVFTFQTSSQVVGTPPAQAGPGGLTSSNHTTVSSTDLAGSGVLPFRGTLTGAVTAGGRLTLAFKGKGVTALKAGRYTITVVDKSSTSGFFVEKKTHPLAVTGAAFVGKKSKSVQLTTGRWFFMPALGTKTFAVTVS